MEPFVRFLKKFIQKKIYKGRRLRYNEDNTEKEELP